MSKSNKLDSNIQTSTQSVKDKLKRVILHDLEHGKQGRPRKSDENYFCHV